MSKDKREGDQQDDKKKAELYDLSDKEGTDYYLREESRYAMTRFDKQGEYTLEDYNALPDDLRVELIDGVFYIMEAPGFMHQDLARLFYDQLRSFFAGKKGLCKPFFAPLNVRLDCDDQTMLQPDILILCDPTKVQKWGINGAPDFCLEIVSPSTMRKDYFTKLQKYKDAGVKEYWILDPYKKRLLTYCWKDAYTPHVHPLKGNIPMELYDGQMMINLDSFLEAITEDLDDRE